MGLGPDFSLVQGDRLPAMQFQLTDTDPEDPTREIPVNLTQGIAMVLVLVPMGETEPTLGGPATFVDPRTDGLGQYDWAAADSENPGSLNGHVRVTYSDGRQETFPKRRYLWIEILERLPPAPAP